MDASTQPSTAASTTDTAPAAATAAWQLLGARPPKVFAMHIGYAARAAQKGRTPEAPGYFLKPATSLTTGGEVVAPAGTEIFGFEGEIAIVIGRGGRAIDEADAWGHVAHVTASNDLGVFDLRWADKGSNIRSKGGDGFTAIGPALLPAERLDPASIEVRTWLDGELVQEDSSSTLLFSLAQIVSDLSQLVTLEPGDVILTGTPANASTFGPGQRVEVEVSATDLDGERLSTGRLASTVRVGDQQLPPYSAQPKPTPEQWADASGRPIDEFRAESAPVLDDELRAQLSTIALATLSSGLRKRGLNNVSIDGLRSTQPGKRIVGTARTLRYVPNREDLFTSHGGGYNAQKRLFDDLHEGDVVVIEARGDNRSGTLGDILALRARHLGAAGIVTDGGVRDLDVVTEIGVPTYHAGGHPAVLGRLHVPWSYDETVACGGATVQPGDIIVADGDGVLVIPPALVRELVEESIEQERAEEFIAAQVDAGERIDGLFPMNAEWRAKYAASQEQAGA
ncbi:fumarylacetoacetate hydrolase family protein [Agrococcus carbonis]|uniref:2-keto-4-pentenoate hydratase/2-oxohepta-3-ene-1,7-dioic acid hydratase (Catechol pathway) n=1 Tax=Agrococcus carbonis TaxID=684552 RepID=A0A1H1LSD3_9MICO|nr:fumarylacetoacetate hydrolase family protein [Agrococcus carbonis]SDR77431.1 2-keto-4-pentenoate hydratase/2-oxohepta-3-ene-1,7-dioic acid hydratase (catechol pathway) [Agrococcus carbonis]